MAESITLARPYANAVFETALAEKDLGTWSNMLSMLAALAAHEKVRAELNDPALTAAQQSQLLINLAGDALSLKGQKLVKLLAENKRLVLLPEIAEIFETLKANQERTVEVELSTAFELSKEVIAMLTQALQTRLSRQINLQTTVDRQLIGGAVIRAGDMVIDNSVRGKLTKLAEAMNS